MNSNTGRLIPLEALRGAAALIVLIHHFFLGFRPETSGLIAGTRTARSLLGSPLFVFLNGTGAVYFFFVLSGFVLCWSFFGNGDLERLKLAFFKRLPRLMGAVTVTTVGSYLLFRLGLYQFQEAARLSGSPWLATFANSGWTPRFSHASGTRPGRA